VAYRDRDIPEAVVNHLPYHDLKNRVFADGHEWFREDRAVRAKARARSSRLDDRAAHV
jgi:hypothetical protein